MSMNLKKDIVIPAGTIFESAPEKREYWSRHAEYIFDIGPDNCGTVTVPVEPNDPYFSEWFESEDDRRY
jgi:hypothetical protein